MCHRLSFSAVGLFVIAATTGCPSDPATSNCDIEKHRLAGTELTLMADARMDAVGEGFVLFGSTGTDVRWASLGKDGTLGAEHHLNAPIIPAHVGPVLFAVAGQDVPGDSVVIAFVPAGAPTTGMVNLMTLSVTFDNTMPGEPQILAQIPAAAKVAMVSGRGGMHAALAWGVPGVRAVTARIVGGDGRAIGTDLGLGAPDDFDCLRFSPGRADMTLGYVDLSGTPPAPAFVGTEIGADGTPQPSFRLPIGKQPPSCVEMAPTDTGYGFAWHSTGIGTYFGMYTPGNPQFPSFEVLADVQVAGGPPSLAGLGWMGKGYSILFARPTGGEVWPIDAMGHRQGTVPVFPSMVGHTGLLSSQPAGNALYATYADYTYADPTNTTAGVRFLVKVSCP
ncbi:MAG: hypothetical protein ABUR63_09595 [Verrucomicrobiota bacterium]